MVLLQGSEWAPGSTFYRAGASGHIDRDDTPIAPSAGPRYPVGPPLSESALGLSPAQRFHGAHYRGH